MVTRKPVNPDAKGETRSSGRSRSPARVGELELTAWKRCGMLTTMDVNGKPVKNAFLLISAPSSAQDIRGDLKEDGGAYNIIPTKILLPNNLIGKMGS